MFGIVKFSFFVKHLFPPWWMAVDGVLKSTSAHNICSCSCEGASKTRGHSGNNSAKGEHTTSDVRQCEEMWSQVPQCLLVLAFWCYFMCYQEQRTRGNCLTFILLWISCSSNTYCKFFAMNTSINIARGTTDPEIDSETWTKLGNNMAPLALIANLATRWRHLTFSH